MSDRQYARVEVAPKIEGTSKEPKAHLFVTFTRVPGRVRVVCKRDLENAEVRDVLPATWRLCGTCERRERAS